MRPQTLAVRLFLCFIGTSGSSSRLRFIQTNKDLKLTVTEEVQIGEDVFYWKFNNKNILQLTGKKNKKNKNYKGRVDFSPQNLSLVLKNVQLSDSGIYTAEVFREDDEILSKYDVTVEAPVSPVLLSVDSVFNSPESCNFTVSCTAELSPSISRSFICDRRTCEESSPAPSDPAPSLHLQLSNVSIICNHSNHVSWRNDTTEIQQVCPFGTGGPDDKLKGTADIGAIVGGTVLILCLICLGVVLQKRRKNKRIVWENTLYEAPQQLPHRPPGRDFVSTESLQSTAIYSEVHSSFDSCFDTVPVRFLSDLLQTGSDVTGTWGKILRPRRDQPTGSVALSESYCSGSTAPCMMGKRPPVSGSRSGDWIRVCSDQKHVTSSSSPQGNTSELNKSI